MLIALGIIIGAIVIFGAGFFVGANNSGKVKKAEDKVAKYQKIVANAPDQIKAAAKDAGL